MGTFLNLYVKHDDPAEIATLLQELSGNYELSRGAYPENYHEFILTFQHANPTYVIIGNTQNGWTDVSLNSFKKLEDWAENLSARLETAVVQVMGQTASDWYYLLMFEKGELRREIEVARDEPEDCVSIGETFPFETSVLPVNENEASEVLFDIDHLEEFGKALGFDIRYNAPAGEQYYLLKHPDIAAGDKGPVGIVARKPWWKFW